MSLSHEPYSDMYMTHDLSRVRDIYPTHVDISLSRTLDSSVSSLWYLQDSTSVLSSWYQHDSWLISHVDVSLSRTLHVPDSSCVSISWYPHDSCRYLSVSNPRLICHEFVKSPRLIICLEFVISTWLISHEDVYVSRTLEWHVPDSSSVSSSCDIYMTHQSCRYLSLTSHSLMTHHLSRVRDIHTTHQSCRYLSLTNPRLIHGP